VGIVLATGLYARRQRHDPAALVAALLASVSAFQVYYAQETRMYAWVTLWGLLSMLALRGLLTALRTGRRRLLYAVLYAAPTLAALYSHYIAVTLVLALWLGTATAARPYSALDYGVTGAAFAGISVPSFFTAMALIYVFALRLGWFPTSGLEDYAAGHTGIALFLDRLRHLVLPVTVLVLTGAAELVRHVRSAVLEELGQDYVRTARSKGVSERAVLRRHALRNSLLPVITLVGVALPRLLAGSVITETVFTWPGMGRLLVESVFARDYPVAMAINMLAAVLVLAGSLLADVLYAAVDPRVRYS